jgi:hypothetical protein
MNALPFLLAGVAAVAITIGGISSSLRRNKELTDLASVRRWDTRKRDPDLPATFGGRPFGEGHGRLAQNVMRGRHNDRTVLVFDYLYKTRGNDGDDTHRYWVACVEDLPAPLPPVEVVKRRKLFTGRPSRFGGVEVQSGDPAFDERYRVTAADPRLAVGLLGPDLVGLLMSWPDFQWRIEGTRLITWGKGKAAPHWIEPTLNMLCTLAGAFPLDLPRY